MSVRMKRTSRKARSARSHQALRAPAITIDNEGGGTHLRHRIDLKSGTYRGKQILKKSLANQEQKPTNLSKEVKVK